MLEYSRDLAQNPCHMCMPMGGILALKGIAGSMALLHGSQGCSTYMRRHIAEHFNEPVDVASSSLNEKGTVYGGQANLKQALDNVRRVYQPQVIGELTTCLAETIGEDIRRITYEYRQETKCDCRIVTAATPGYGGTHVEGYWGTLQELLRQTAEPSTPHAGVNLIVPACLSPADLREIKRYLEMFGLEYILLPDISETMDRPFESEYRKIAGGGTALSDIRRMPGAVVTMELGGAVDEKLSPGKWLQDEYKTPLLRLPVPIGLKNTDLFVNVLSQATGCNAEERTRVADGRHDRCSQVLVSCAPGAFWRSRDGWRHGWLLRGKRDVSPSCGKRWRRQGMVQDSSATAGGSVGTGLDSGKNRHGGSFGAKCGR